MLGLGREENREKPFHRANYIPVSLVGEGGKIENKSIKLYGLTRGYI